VLGIIFLTCVSLSAQDYQAFVKKGDEYYEQFRNQEALAEYQKAYEIAPDEYAVLMKLTRAYNDVGEDLNSDEAEIHFKKAISHAKLLQEKFPDRAEAYFYLAATSGNLALSKSGKEKVRLSRDIEKYAKKSITLDPEFASGYIALGIYYREVANLNWFLKAFAKTIFGGLPNGTNEDSEKMLLEAIKREPSVLVYYELAGTYKEMGEKERAIENLKKSIELPIVDHQDERRKAEAKKMLSKLQK
jgi:tetratricopeptide (TPR) repeat protein